MSVFHKTMVWLGLVDDDEYYGDDDEYYADEYGDPVRRRDAAPRRRARPRPRPRLRRPSRVRSP